jgi:hypothetical protein
MTISISQNQSASQVIATNDCVSTLAENIKSFRDTILANQKAHIDAKKELFENHRKKILNAMPLNAETGALVPVTQPDEKTGALVLATKPLNAETGALVVLNNNSDGNEAKPIEVEKNQKNVETFGSEVRKLTPQELASRRKEESAENTESQAKSNTPRSMLRNVLVAGGLAVGVGLYAAHRAGKLPSLETVKENASDFAQNVKGKVAEGLVTLGKFATESSKKSAELMQTAHSKSSELVQSVSSKFNALELGVSASATEFTSSAALVAQAAIAYFKQEMKHFSVV